MYFEEIRVEVKFITLLKKRPRENAIHSNKTDIVASFQLDCEINLESGPCTKYKSQTA
jgi:hypothetical protein